MLISFKVGCGTGVYPVKTAELFKDIEYTGNDFSQQCIDYCKKNSSLILFVKISSKWNLRKNLIWFFHIQ